jgi:hypothetical protein
MFGNCNQGWHHQLGAIFHWEFRPDPRLPPGWWVRKVEQHARTPENERGHIIDSKKLRIL